MAEAFIGMGSNLGDREAMLAAALAALEREGLSISRRSSIYETAAVGLEEQPDFLNMVIGLEPAPAPPALLQQLMRIEAQLGRRRTIRWGARSIDLDLLCIAGIASWRTQELILPHPRLHERRFVLVPLDEIAADFYIEGLGATVHELLLNCPDSHAVRRFGRAENVQ